MAIEFSRTFGATANKPAAPAQADRVKAQIWLNIGYSSGIVDEQGNDRFVSLPVGIPLDAQEKLPTNSRNTEFGAFQAARNDLIEQLMDAAKNLMPGEERILDLQIQIRRINEDAPVIAPEDNRFIKKLVL